jgi:glycosyltransferase involved in cell wall biosynthesis
MKTVLFVHQSADLYGSDKVLLDIAVGIRSLGFLPIVLLPSRGPLVERLEAAGVETHVTNVAKLSRATFSVAGMLRLPMEIASAVRQIDRIVANRRIDIVHSNTLAVLGGAFWAKWRRIRHLWHVHELIVSPKVARLGFPRLVGWFSDVVMTNSTLTQKWMLDTNPNLAGRTTVVWNGVSRGSRAVQSVEPRAETVTVALVGRINRLKGQPVLVETAKRLWNRGIRSVNYLLVGSPPAGQEHYLDNLRRTIASSPAQNAITLRDFTDDVWSIWDNCDIAVVPSTEPESFGLVAIEAMAAGRPVIAAAHGGLLDIVVDGETGTLVPPNDADALANAIGELAGDPGLRVRYGEAGQRRQASLFSLEHQVAETVKCYESMTDRGV